MFLTREQSRRVDQWAVERYGLSSLVLMENAGRGATDQLMAEILRGPVVILAGGGNNGGDGLVVARHLAIRGVACQTHVFSTPEKLSDDTRANLEIAQRLALPVTMHDPGVSPSGELGRQLAAQLAEADFVVDGLLGTGAQGDPRGAMAGLIEQVNALECRTLALDVPSGLDCETGTPGRPTLRATLTVTFASQKTGFRNPAAAAYLGKVHVADIGLPRHIVAEAAME